MLAVACFRRNMGHSNEVHDKTADSYKYTAKCVGKFCVDATHIRVHSQANNGKDSSCWKLRQRFKKKRKYEKN